MTENQSKRALPIDQGEEMNQPDSPTIHRGCEIHSREDGSFDVYEVGEDPTTTQPYANVPSLQEARLVIDSLFELYAAKSILDALFGNS